MSAYPVEYYQFRNTKIVELAKTEPLEELARIFRLSLPRTRDIVNWFVPQLLYRNYERSLRERREQKKAEKLDKKLKQELNQRPKWRKVTLQALSENPQMLFDLVLFNDKTGCWEWCGAKNSQGYGALSVDGKRQLAHRVSAHLAGKLPELRSPTGVDDPAVIMHECDNPSCIRPDHLKVGTIRENFADKIQKGRSRNGAMGKLPKK